MVDIINAGGSIQGSSQLATNLNIATNCSPGYISGNYYPAGSMNNAIPAMVVVGISFSGASIYYYPFYCLSTQFFSGVSFRVSTASGSGTTLINMGVYNNSTSDNSPSGVPITGTTSGDIAGNTSSTQLTYTFPSPILLIGGTIYWVAVACNDASTLFPTYAAITAASGNFSNGLVSATLASTNTNFIGYEQVFTYNSVLPVAANLVKIDGTGITKRVPHLFMVAL